MARCGEGASVADCARQRCVQVHSLLAGLNEAGDGVAALAGFYMDCHVPAMTFGGTVQELYIHRKAPEDSHAFPCSCYPTANHAAEAVKAWHSHIHHEVTDMSVKLMRKGGPVPSSVRYVAGLLKRCAAETSPVSHAVRTMLISHLLGNYRHSLVAADPARRVQVYRMSTPALCAEVCQALATRQLHDVVCEFVAANTVEHQALSRSIGLRIETTAPTVCTMNRGSMAHTKNVRSQPYSIFCVMTKALNVHHTTVRVAEKTLGAERVAAIMDEVFGRPLVFGTTRGAFRRVGLSDDEVQAVVACFSEPRLSSLKMMRHRLKVLSPESHAALCTYMWCVRQVLSLSVTLLSKRVRAAQAAALARCNGRTANYVTVCCVCASVQAQIDGACIPKTKQGVAIDPLTSRTSCNACQRSYIKVVDLVGRAVWFHRRGERVRIAMCCMCSQACCSPEVVGMYPTCRLCAPKLKQRMCAPKKCLCGADGSGPWTMVRHKQDVITVSLCHKHAHLAPDSLVDHDALAQEVHATR